MPERAAGTRILALCDPHFDFAPRKKERWLRQDPGPIDLLVVAGDVANDPDAAETFFQSVDHIRAPRLIVKGNHDARYGPSAHKYAHGWDGGGWPIPTDVSFEDLCEQYGYDHLKADQPYGVVDGALLFNLRYEENLTDEEIQYTNDPNFFPVHRSCQRLPDPVDPPRVRFSVSHLAPNWNLPTKYEARSRMYYNRDVDRVLRAHRSPVHFYGHTHETVDHVLDGVRYVNRCVGYEAPLKVLKPLSSFVVEVPDA